MKLVKVTVWRVPDPENGWGLERDKFFDGGPDEKEERAYEIVGGLGHKGTLVLSVQLARKQKGVIKMNIRNVVTLFTFVLATVVSINTHAQDSRIYIDGRSAADANVPPYSGAVLIGDTLHLAGSIGLDENLKVPDDPADEARNTCHFWRW